MKEVRILLVGERGVGKTSLILSLVSEEFYAEVPPRAEEITIPADVTPEKVPTVIVDYSEQEQTESQLSTEIRRANVICVVYDVTNEKSISKITEYWLPFIQQSLKDSRDDKTPVIMVGNKSDLIEESRLDALLPIMNKFTEVETCIECSARRMKNLSETFWFAQKAVLYPTAPLYTADLKELTANCKKALTRIFRICDMDNDGFMNDKELEAFQRRCFKIPLHPQSLEDVKHLVRKNTSDGFTLQGLTQKGFLFLHQTFVQKGRHETIWAVLRCFGYDNQLKLTKEYIRPTLRVPFGCSTELSYQGQHFLQFMFTKYDSNRDGCLSPAELQNFFSTCPFIPWGPDVCNTVLTNHLGWISKQGFMAQWTLTAYLDVTRVLEYLAYLGYTYEFEGLTSAITVTREKRLDYHRRQTNRNVFYCRVYGSKKVGKTCFLQAFLGRNLQYIATLKRDNLPSYTCNCLNLYDSEKYLILHEIDWARGEQMTQEEALSTDVVCLLYDITDPASFKYVADIYMNYYRGTRVPCLIVATKSEQVEIPQYYPLDPNEFCAKYKLQPLHKFSCLDKLSPDVYAKLITMANYPHLRGMQIAQGDYAWKFTIAATVLAGFGFMAFKMAKTHL